MLLPTLRRLDLMLTRSATPLGPPMYLDREKAAVWAKRTLKDTPILERWTPPATVEPTDDGAGFVLMQNTLCFQRGYQPDAMFDQYVQVLSDRFHHDEKESRHNITGLAFDFLVVIVSHASSPPCVAAGCMVEFRCSARAIPYLYIASLCTHRDHLGHRLAHQLVHSVHILGALLLKQNRTAGAPWRDAIPDGVLYLGLTVRKTPGSDEDSRLVKLYSDCGLATRDMEPGLPEIDYGSFTPYSIYSWRLEHQSSMIAMWKRIEPGVWYRDANGSILDPLEREGESMYYEFEEENVELVRASGIVHSKHAHLFADRDAVHADGSENITFTRTPPASGGFFRIMTENVRTERFTVKISVPRFCAAKVDSASRPLLRG